MSDTAQLQQQIDSLRSTFQGALAGGHNGPGWHDIEQAEKRASKAAEKQLDELAAQIAATNATVSKLTDLFHTFAKGNPEAMDKKILPYVEAVVEEVVKVEKAIESRIQQTAGAMAQDAAVLRGLTAQEAVDAHAALTSLCYRFAYSE